ncbi:MarR family transcriptional regulator [Nocardia cyriacigeorgica]|uniref:MarR family transcriptional regulator n=1 Tax=Nocardia cyriacigeorgica TaxID=135487 RepID=A0A6P1D6N1_9NOCA|nr:MarR family transcriptional regulator [Nocardia cyriacigeorgica]NEW45728.1 MarR family transcriptional regulator [Nocardia cyriacigeorgica]NEW55806.1 MarR family transcriptional regulator [Nocardia cyriacigeorgica]
MASELGFGDALERFLTGLFSASRSDSADKLVELDLSLSQARTLFVLGHDDRQQLPIHAIAERLSLSVTAAGRNVDRLVRLGLATRDESPEDRRVKLVGLSEHGREVIHDQMMCHREALDQLVERLPDDVRDDLHAAIIGVLDSGALASVPTPAVSTGDPS